MLTGGSDLIWSLLIAYQVKHFVADYLLQGRWMLGKFKPYPDFILPLLAHSAVHGLFTLAIALYVRPELCWVSLVDLAVHFGVDRLKAAPSLGGRWKYHQPQYWYALGADQMAHHLCHYWIIWMLLTP